MFTRSFHRSKFDWSPPHLMSTPELLLLGRRRHARERVALFICLLLALLLSALSFGSDPQPSFRLTVVPVLPGGSKSLATDININGVITGYSTTNGIADPHAFTWDPAVGGLVDLGTLSGNPADDSFAWAIADQGHVVGDSEYGANPFLDAFIAVNGVPPMAPIGPLPPGYVLGSPHDIKFVRSLGVHRVAGWFLTPPPQTPVAGYWDHEAGTSVNLGTLTGMPGEWSRALGVNTNGDVVGFSTRGTLPGHAFFSPGGAVPIIDVDGRMGGGDSYAFALNNSLQVVGFYYPSMTARHHACRFQDVRGAWQLTDLGRLPGPTDLYSSAWDIAESGLVVGWSESPSSGRLACMWLNERIADLNQHVVGGTHGLVLKEAMGLNEAGQIVGYALDLQGLEQGFILTPANLILSTPAPGVAGVMNTLTAYGAGAGTRIHFVYGFSMGTTPVPGCPGLSVDIANPVVIGFTLADARGVALLRANVPLAARNRTIRLQAVDLVGCQVSNVVAYLMK